MASVAVLELEILLAVRRRAVCFSSCFGVESVEQIVNGPTPELVSVRCFYALGRVNSR